MSATADTGFSGLGTGDDVTGVGFGASKIATGFSGLDIGVGVGTKGAGLGASKMVRGASVTISGMEMVTLAASGAGSTMAGMSVVMVLVGGAVVASPILFRTAAQMTGETRPMPAGL